MPHPRSFFCCCYKSCVFPWITLRITPENELAWQHLVMLGLMSTTCLCVLFNQLWHTLFEYALLWGEDFRLNIGLFLTHLKKKKKSLSKPYDKFVRYVILDLDGECSPFILLVLYGKEQHDHCAKCLSLCCKMKWDGARVRVNSSFKMHPKLDRITWLLKRFMQMKGNWKG